MQHTDSKHPVSVAVLHQSWLQPIQLGKVPSQMDLTLFFVKDNHTLLESNHKFSEK